MKFKIDKGTGYMYCYCPSHPLANAAGKVMEHVYVMSTIIGRPLMNDECVHHIDRDRTNNDPSNLQLMKTWEHAKLHQIEDNGVIYIDKACEFCGDIFETTESSLRKFCCLSCSHEDTLKFNISKEELSVLVWKIPTTTIAKQLGVSDVAVAKRCKKFGISKPPRGYWS